MKSNNIPVLSLLCLLFSMNFLYGSGNSAQDFNLSIRNFTQTTDRTFEFDIYLLDTDPAQPFQLASVQCGITVNPAIFAGGSLSSSIVAGTSTLNLAQSPVYVVFTPGTGACVIKLAPAIPPGSGTGTIISAIAPGSRVVRIKVTSTVPFAANTQPDLSFVPDGAVLPLYPSRVAIYQSGLNTQLSVVTGSNATITVNPFLNSSYPAQYQVTGGGTYCQSNGGLPVGLAGSQTGVVYTLYKNGASTGVTMAGTGFAVVFPGNQPAGNYTVWGTNAAGNKEMLNSVSVNVYPTPVTNQAVPATTVSTGQSLCKDALQTLTTGGSGNNFTVNAGGSAQLVAGLKISLLPGTTVLPNGLLHAWIETGCVFCSLQKSAQMVEEISLDQTYQDTHSPTTATILRVYPNPTDGLVNIEIPDKPGDEDVSVTIWSTTGIMAAEARQFSQHTFRVDFSGMQPGLFILRIETGNHIYTARVVRL